MGVAGRQFLVRWRDDPEWSTKPGHEADCFENWGNLLAALHVTPIVEGLLQRRDLYPLRRQLPEHTGSVAVLVARAALPIGNWSRERFEHFSAMDLFDCGGHILEQPRSKDVARRSYSERGPYQVF